MYVPHPRRSRHSACPIQNLVEEHYESRLRMNPLLTHFIPVLLYTALCAIRECLIHDFSHFHVQDDNPRTFAISLQLLPASRIVFNLCSSAGVHGVFVLLFFGGGAEKDDSAKVGDGSPRLPVSP